MGRGAARWAWAAIAGIAVYLLVDVALVYLRPHLSVLHSAESDYGSRGAYAWVMDLNFLLRCVLSLCAVRALMLAAPPGPRLRLGLLLLAVWAVGSGLLAFFPDDPAGTTLHGSGKVHVALAGIAFVGVIAGTLITTRALAAEPAWRPVRKALLVLAWGALVPILLLGHAHLRTNSLGGLYEKLFLGAELLWLLVASAWIVRLERERAPASDAALAR
jgi:hypothetical membrane protein